MHKGAQHWVVSVRKLAPSPCPSVCKRAICFLTGKPLKCQLRPMMVCIGRAPEGWGYYTWFLGSPSSLPRKLLYKTNLEADPRSILAPL